MTSRPFPQLRADALASKLNVELDGPICYACLSFVSFALEEGDPTEIARQTRRVTADLWHEGLAELALGAVQSACDRGIADADAALADLERNCGRSSVTRSIVRRLAQELSLRRRAELRIKAMARDRLQLAPPELN